MSSLHYDVVMRMRNPGATTDLVVPVTLLCNTTDEMLFSNIYQNSRRSGDWVKVEKPHDGVALVCGGGASLLDTLPEIERLQQEGGLVFALNGAAQFLHNHGIMPDYQIIVDARAETRELIGPAKQYLFASQVHPSLFDVCPDALVWHQAIDGMEDHFPEYDNAYALVGGGSAVGVSATSLVYTLGFRSIHCFGLDSCHRGEASHAYAQPMNSEEPVTAVSFNGKHYHASFTMKSQAERFMQVSKALKEAGCSVWVHGSGLLPDMFHAGVIEERAKYEAMWNIPEYRVYSPGEGWVDTFLAVTKLSGVIVDFGCGTGRGGLRISNLTGLPVTLVDFTENSRDEAARALHFVRADLSVGPLPIVAQFGYCCDVMEHIPPVAVPGVIQNIMDACIEGCFFAISTDDDNMGSLIGQPLHLTVQPFKWWRELFEQLGYFVAWSQDSTESALFFVEHTHGNS